MGSVASLGIIFAADIHQLSMCSTMSVAFFLSVFLIPVIEGEQLRWAITVVMVQWRNIIVWHKSVA